MFITFLYFIKESVLQVIRWVLLYIIQKFAIYHSKVFFNAYHCLA